MAARSIFGSKMTCPFIRLVIEQTEVEALAALSSRLAL
jgi:hypothetical protein